MNLREKVTDLAISVDCKPFDKFGSAANVNLGNLVLRIYGAHHTLSDGDRQNIRGYLSEKGIRTINCKNNPKDILVIFEDAESARDFVQDLSANARVAHWTRENSSHSNPVPQPLTEFAEAVDGWFDKFARDQAKAARSIHAGGEAQPARQGPNSYTGGANRFCETDTRRRSNAHLFPNGRTPVEPRPPVQPTPISSEEIGETQTGAAAAR